MRLSSLRTGEKGIIIKVYGHGGFRKRIVEMGFVKGQEVEVLLNAPLKDPIKYKIMGYEISLRHQEAALIEVLSEKEGVLIQDNAQPEKKQYPLHKTSPISEKSLKALAQQKRRTINVALVGNPNCGKTSLFNIISGAHEHVGNYSGVTVDAKEVLFDFQGYHFRLIDLPGTYSLSTYSPEELYVRKHILDEMPDIILNVVDASNLERNLYLTTQLIDMNVRMVVALNMYDELEASGNKLNHILLSKLFGVPMIPTIGRKNWGVKELFHIIIKVYEGADFLNEKGEIDENTLEYLRNWHRTYVKENDHKDEHMIPSDGEDSVSGNRQMKNYYRHIHINHGPEIEKAIDKIKIEIAKNENIRHKYSTRFLAIKLLEKDNELEKFIRTLPNHDAIFKVRDKESKTLEKELKEDSESAIMNAKYGYIAGALKETFTDNHLEKQQFTKFLDTIVTHRIWGYPIFFLFLYLMFKVTFVFGEYPMQAIEWGIAQIGNLIQQHMAEGVLKELIIDGIIGGVGGVIVFLPNILLLYFFISLMEDSGYMARAAFIMDKIMHKMGLHGKSFIPLIMGFGCNVPAIIASRTIEDHKSRLITILINPLMSCSARLPIYLLLTATFFPQCPSLVLFSIYTTGIVLAIVIARIFSKVLIKNNDTPFVMELPPYRLPSCRSILRHTWEKGEQYLRKMGGIIMIASIIIWFLGYYPHSNQDNLTLQQENSYIGQIGKAIEPIIKPLGFDWKMGIGLISGIGAKELIVSTIGVLYAQEEDAQFSSLASKIPITPIAALSYMLFVAIYFPCIATVTAIKQESGSWKWSFFTILYTTALAWIVAFTVYQIGQVITL